MVGDAVEVSVGCVGRYDVVDSVSRRYGRLCK